VGRWRQRLRAAETEDAAISDVGETGVFKAHSSLYVTASAYLKGRVLQLSLDGFDAREKKGQLLSLLKSAASRMQKSGVDDYRWPSLVVFASFFSSPGASSGV
jgi:hypothetical protein